MSTSHHRRAQELFEAACQLAHDERAAFLAHECGGDEELRAQVAALLELDSKGTSRFDEPALERLRTDLLPVGGPLPERIGRYRVLSRLGAGGMGVVYEAEQDHPRRRVALKVLRADLVSPEMLRRFEVEAQALAWLNHPGIATVYEMGTAETIRGREPYLAMELVRGERLDAYARSRGLSIRQRLELVAEICDAVHHAHQKGVIHRDLKPANIFVTASGEPKILDFGVARIIGSDLEGVTRATSAGEILGTLSYMSPEQVQGNASLLDLRSDVYTLGVLAFELLSGKRPHDVSSCALHEAIRIIVNDEPTSLGLVDRKLRGDVETIVHKALAKERERRYSSAAELADDFRRHLADEPILARPASRSYQLRKFTRRNKILVGGVAAVFVVLLLGALTSTLLFFEKEEQRSAAEDRGKELEKALGTATANLERALEAEELARGETARARFEADTAQAVTDYLVTLFEYANPERTGGGKITALEMLDQGVERIRGELFDRPAIRARLLNVFGKIYNWLQLYERSRPILEEALALTAELHGEDSAEYADTLERLAQVHLEAEDLATSERLQRRVLELREKHLGKDHPLYTDALNNLANSLSSKGDYEEAERLLLEARELRVARLGPEHADVASVEHNLGILYGFLGRDEEAERYLSRASTGLRAHYGDDHWRSLLSRAALADCLRMLGRDAEALGHAEASYEGLRTLFGESSAMTSRALKTYASCLRDGGEPEKAAEILEELLERHQALRGVDAEYSHLLHILASTLHDLERYDEAESLYLDALELRATFEAASPQVTLETRHNLAVLYQETERLDEALELELAVLSQRERLLGAAHPDTRGSLNNLAQIYGKLARPLDEEGVRRRKLAAVERELGPDSPDTLLARLELAEFLVRNAVFEEAEELLLAAWDRHGLAGAGMTPDAALRIPEALIALYEFWARPEQAARWTARRDELVHAAAQVR